MRGQPRSDSLMRTLQLSNITRGSGYIADRVRAVEEAAVMSKSSRIISTFEFLEKFMNNNQVCIFPKAISSDWNAVKYWTKEGKISLSYLKENFGKDRGKMERRIGRERSSL